MTQEKDMPVASGWQSETEPQFVKEWRAYKGAWTNGAVSGFLFALILILAAVAVRNA